MSTLNDTTDAMVWAEEFCRIFDGWIVRQHTWADHDNEINAGGMVGWFANAIEVGRTAGAQAHCPHPTTERSEPAENLVTCRKCGKVWITA